MSSLLEAFYFIFEGNTSSLDKSLRDAKKQNDGLKLSLISTDEAASKLGGSFQNMIKRAGAFLVTLAGIGATVGAIKNAKEYANHLQDLSDALGVSVESLDVWGQAVKTNGGTAEGFQETLKSMEGSLQSFAVTGHSRVAPFFEELGINLKNSAGKVRSFFDLLPELADRFQKLGKTQSFGIGLRMGLDQGTIMLLQQGRLAVDDIIRRQKELGVVTKEDAEIAAKFNKQWDETGHSFRSLFTQSNSTILPILTDIFKRVEKIVNFLREHSEFTKQFILHLAAAITGVLLPAMIRLAIATVAATWPFLLIAGAIGIVSAAVAFAIDDFKAFKNGGKSLTRTLLRIIEVLKFLGGVVSTAVSNQVKAGMEKITHWIEIAKEKILAVIDKIKNSFNRVKRFFGIKQTEEMQVSINDANLAFASANQNPLTSSSSSFLNTVKTNNRTVNINGPIEITTQATDADSIATGIGQGLDYQLRQANDHFDDGRAI